MRLKGTTLQIMGNWRQPVHVGDQASSETAYAALHAWMKSNGKRPAGAPWEVYVADGTMEIFFPIC